MNINGLNGSLGAYQAQMNRTNQANAQRTQETGNDATQSANAAKPQQTGDKVEMSPNAVLRTTALTTAMKTPDVRQEKVDSIKQSLDNGSYTIDNRKIATKLVQDERAIFGK